MKIDHLAIWTRDLENMKDFYIKYFNGIANAKYVNTKKAFESYFITFDSGARIELMSLPSIESKDTHQKTIFQGYAHLAFSTGSRENVDSLTSLLRDAGYKVIGEPRTTGDGYYESCILDPEGNMVEITA